MYKKSNIAESELNWKEDNVFIFMDELWVITHVGIYATYVIHPPENNDNIFIESIRWLRKNKDEKFLHY